MKSLWKQVPEGQKSLLFIGVGLLFATLVFWVVPDFIVRVLSFISYCILVLMICFGTAAILKEKLDDWSDE